ncbi:hypothetical protein [Candidiatus Paracoxiella cheracis]
MSDKSQLSDQVESSTFKLSRIASRLLTGMAIIYHEHRDTLELLSSVILI